MEEGWERSPRVEITHSELQRLIEPAFPGGELAEHEVLTSGLANTNIRFRVRGRDGAYVLRLHTREPKAAARECALMAYLSSHAGAAIPVPPLLYSDAASAHGAHP